MFEKLSTTFSELRIYAAGLSGAAWITIITFCGLLLLTLFAWLLAWNNPLWVPWGAYLTPTRGLMLLGLAVVASGAEYLLFQIWFDERPIPHADVRRGWNDGLGHIRRVGINPRSMPCFMLLDPTDSCESWFDAAGIKVEKPESAAESPVDWYLGEESLFLTIQGLGCLGPLTRELEEMRRRPAHFAMSTYAQATTAQPAMATAAIGSGDETPDIAEHATLDDDRDPAVAAIDVDAVRDALQGGTTESQAGLPDESTTDDFNDAAVTELSDVRLSSTEIAHQSQRLADVCRRLVACRRPVVPINGICVLLPDGVFTNLAGSGIRLGQALRHDLQMLQQELDVVAPVSVVLIGAEEDTGIVELIRRGGKDAAKSGLLGMDVNPSRTSPESAMQFCGSLVQSLQQQIGRRLRDPRTVGRPGANRLFRLMSSMRGNRGEELQSFITQAFTREDGEELDVLAGLSFAATGEHLTARAFAGSAYRQLIENQEFVEWTKAARRRERQLRWVARACGSLSVVAVIGLVALLLRYA